MKEGVQNLGSKASAIASRRRSMEKYRLNPAICLQCNKVIEVKPDQKPATVKKRRFCSHGCAGRYNNLRHPKRKPEGICDGCGSQIKASLKYCGTACKSNSRHRRNREEVKAGNKKSVIEWRQRTKIRAVAYKGGKCCKCGYDRCVRALDFHHVDPSLKDFQVSGVSRSWDKIRVELDKCILVCSNCHRELHDGMWTV